VSEFFEPPPPPEEPEEPDRCHRQPDWFGPPEGTLPSIVPLELVLARSAKAAVYVTHLAAYPAGFRFELQMVAASEHDDDLYLDPMMMFHHHRARRGRQAELPPELLRVGVQFQDGRKATSTGGPPHPFDSDESPREPVMTEEGGGGGVGCWQQRYWVWPLPPPGGLQLVCEWPAAGIPLTRKEIDSQLILDAARRAKAIFPEADLRQGHSSTSYAPLRSGPRAEPRSD
jgi:hypothetical protein